LDARASQAGENQLIPAILAKLAIDKCDSVVTDAGEIGFRHQCFAKIRRQYRWKQNAIE
jgi:hypothetical protein